MNSKEKYKIAFRLSTGASCGLHFLEDYLSVNKVTDIAYIRSISLLFSYNFELLLKSRFTMVDSFKNEQDLRIKLRKLSHNLIKIKNKLGKKELSKIGIREISQNDTKYIIDTTKNTRIEIEDFTDLRYDYLFGKSRNVNGYEYSNMVNYITELFIILKYVKKYNENEK